jgi:hypothetical protein
MIGKIAIGLADNCKIELQKNIMDYRTDGLITITSLKCDKIDKIILEINENNHQSYNKDESKFRDDLLKTFKNRIINIPINRTAKKHEMDEVVELKIKEIKYLVNDLIAQYSLDSISHDEFIKLLQKEMLIDINFAKMFAKQNHPVLDNFKYLHSEIAKFLGYVCDETGYCRTFIDLLKKYIIEDIHYICVFEDEQNPADVRRVLLDEKKGGRKQKIKYYLSRLGFYIICMSSNTIKAKQYKLQFGTVYEIALNYIQGLKNKIVDAQPSPDNMNKLVKERMNTKIEHKLAHKKEIKIEVLLNEKTKENDELKIIIEQQQKEIDHLKIVNADLYSKLNLFNKTNKRYELKYELKYKSKYKALKNKIMIKQFYDLVKTHNQSFTLELFKIEQYYKDINTRIQL